MLGSLVSPDSTTYKLKILQMPLQILAKHVVELGQDLDKRMSQLPGFCDRGQGDAHVFEVVV